MIHNTSEPLLVELSQIIQTQMGLNFSKKNWNNLKRGLSSAASEFGFQDTESCARWLLSSPLTRDRIDTLARHLTIGETYFFREMNTFNALQDYVLPELLFSRQAGDRRLRIWSAGCSTGEEPYSLAILLSRIIPDIHNWNLTILATDLNPRSLQKATDGVYTAWSFRNPPVWLKSQYFRQQEKCFEIFSNIKRMVTFSALNLAEDVYPSLSNGTNAMDIIFCRNVIMYFSQEFQRKIIQQFYHALVNGGWLIVSPSESSSVLFPQFVTVNFPGAIFFLKGENKEELQQLWFSRMSRVNTFIPPNMEAPSQSKSLALSTSHALETLSRHLSPESFDMANTPLSPSGSTDLSFQTHPVQSIEHEESSLNTSSPTQLQSSSHLTRYEEAVVLYHQGQYEEVVEKLIDVHEVLLDGQASDLLARTYANQGEFVNALEWCEKAIAHDKLNPCYHYLKATILQEQHQFEDAIHALRRVLFLDHDFVLAYFALGNINRQQGQFKEANKHFGSVQRLLQGHAPEDELPESDGITAGRLKEIVDSMLDTQG